MRRWLCLALLAFVACSAQRPATSHDIERQVWSPYCPGRLLIDCTTRQADDLRAEISRRLDRESPNEVMRWIRLNYGNESIARPESFVVWSFPLALFAVGTAVLVVLLRRWRGTLRRDQQRGEADAHSHS